MKRCIFIAIIAAALSMSACGSSEKINGRSAEKFEASVTIALIAATDEDRKYYSDAVTHFVGSSNLNATSPIIRSKLHGKTLREVRLLMVGEKIELIENMTISTKARIEELEEDIEKKRGEAEKEKALQQEAAEKRQTEKQNQQDAVTMAVVKCVNANSLDTLVFEISNPSSQELHVQNIQITYLEHGVRKNIEGYMLEGSELIASNSKTRLELGYLPGEQCLTWSKLRLEFSDQFSSAAFSPAPPSLTSIFENSMLERDQNELTRLKGYLGAIPIKV